MRRLWLGPLALAAGGIGHAAPASVPSPNDQVISYPAAFFAQLQPDTALDMILRLPGFTLDDGSSVRGFGGAAGNVLIDGQRPTSKTDDLASILKRLPASQVLRIDLIRGGTPGIDMQGKSLVANVILKKAGGFTSAAVLGQYTVKQGYKDPNARLEAAWRENGRSLEGSLYAFRGHLNSEGSGPHEIVGPDGELLDKSQTRNSEPNWEYKATAAGEIPVAGGRLRANFTFDAQPFALDSIDNFEFAGRQEEHDRQHQHVAEVGVHFARHVTKDLNIELIGLQQFSQTKFTSDSQTATSDQSFRLDDRQRESVGRVVLHWQGSSDLTAEGGGEFAYNFLRAATDLGVNDVPIALPAANVRVTEKRGEAFSTVTWRPLAALSLEAGMRVETSVIASAGDVSSSRRLTFAKPRVLVTWSPSARDQLRIRIEREVGQLDFSQFVATASLNTTSIFAGNPDLRPQQDWALEAALDHHFWRDAVVSLTVRRLVLRDVIDRAPVFAPSGAFDTPANIGDGSETDVVANLNFPLDRLGMKGFTFQGMATWRRSRVTDPTTSEERRISGQHPIDAELHLSQDLPRLKLNWSAEVFFASTERFFRFNEIDTNHIGGSADIYVDYKPRPDLVFRLQLFTANAYEADRALFGGPRDIALLQSLDTQKRKFGPLIFTRVRKTF